MKRRKKQGQSPEMAKQGRQRDEKQGCDDAERQNCFQPEKESVDDVFQGIFAWRSAPDASERTNFKMNEDTLESVLTFMFTSCFPD